MIYVLNYSNPLRRERQCPEKDYRRLLGRCVRVFTAAHRPFEGIVIGCGDGLVRLVSGADIKRGRSGTILSIPEDKILAIEESFR